MDGTLDSTLMVRLDTEQLQRFKRNCLADLKRPYQEVLREMIEAMNDGRLTIKPTKEQKNAQRKLYND